MKKEKLLEELETQYPQSFKLITVYDGKYTFEGRAILFDPYGKELKVWTGNMIQFNPYNTALNYINKNFSYGSYKLVSAVEGGQS